MTDPMTYHKRTMDGILTDKRTAINAMTTNPLRIELVLSLMFSLFCILPKISLPKVIALMSPLESMVDIIVENKPARKTPYTNGGRIYDANSGYAMAAV